MLRANSAQVNLDKLCLLIVMISGPNKLARREIRILSRKKDWSSYIKFSMILREEKVDAKIFFPRHSKKSISNQVGIGRTLK